MNQDDAKTAYQEAGRLVAEERHDDALVLFDQLSDAFPDNANVIFARSKTLAEVDRHDVRGTDSVQTTEQEVLEWTAVSDEPASQLSRTIAIALIGVGAVGLIGYFFLFGNIVEPISKIVSGATNQAAIAVKLPAQEARSIPSELATPETSAALPELQLSLEGVIGSSQSDATEEVENDQASDEIAQETVLAAMTTRSKDNPIAPLISSFQQQRIDDVEGSDASGPTTVDTAIPETPAEILIEIVQANKLKDAVELLRDNRALANALDYEKRPVLTYAQNVEMAGLLIEAGADYEAPTVGGWTPLMWIAGRNGNTDVAKYLIELGAWVSIEDNNGIRPIHQAAFMGNHDLVSAFVSGGADINAIDDTHVTPLHGAAWSGDQDGVTLYLSLGADPKLQNKKGETAYDFALAREHMELLPLLDSDPTSTSEAVAPLPGSAQTGTAGTRELKFSNDVRLGIVQIREWGSTDYKAWEPAGSAWGTVTIPVGKEVMLMVDVPRLDSLKAIDPEGIQMIHIRDLDLNDEQLLNLYHLKGLRRLTLSRTSISKAAVEALREALPECTIRE